MDGGLLSLKWNNHRSTFLHVLSTVRHKESYCDVTIACDGKFYPVHKLVLSTCSEYFEQMFERTNCKHPIIVLKDIKKEDLEALLNYMYVGEVNVLQNNLSGLIKAAEGLRIKGLAVPDESPSDVDTAQENKRSVPWGADGPETKRRRPEEQSPSSQRGSHASGDKGGRERSPGNYREPFRILPRSREPPRGAASPSSVPVSHSPESHLPNASLLEPSSDLLHPPAHDQGASTQAASSNESTNSSNESAGTTEMKVDEPLVKEEPQESYGESEETKETLQSADSDPGINYSQHTPGLVGEAASGSFTPQGLRPTNQPQTLEELVALPGASGLQGKSLWESDRGLLGMPFEGYSANQARASQLVAMVATARPEAERTPAANTASYSHPLTHFTPICPYCSKSTFYSPRDLERHIRIHTGEKPYKCPHCNYRARLKAHMKSHLFRKHEGILIRGTKGIMS